MGSFFKTVLACLLAMVLFTLLVFLFMTAVVKSIGSGDKPHVADNSVLVLDLGIQYNEQLQQNPLLILSNDPDKNIPGIYDLIRLLRKAKTDEAIRGIYLKADPSPNGFAASAEIRNALADFKESGKFIFAHCDILTQRSFAIANLADRIYVSPQGLVEWYGFSVDYA